MTLFKYLEMKERNQTECKKKSKTHYILAMHTTIQWIIFFLLVCCLETKVKYKKNYNFACCLCGRKTSFFTLTEEHRLRVSENRALKKIWELTKKVAKRCGIKLRNESSGELYSLPHIIKTIKWGPWDGRDMMHLGRGDGQGILSFWCANLKEKHHLGDLGMNRT